MHDDEDQHYRIITSRRLAGAVTGALSGGLALFTFALWYFRRNTPRKRLIIMAFCTIVLAVLAIVFFFTFPPYHTSFSLVTTSRDTWDNTRNKGIALLVTGLALTGIAVILFTFRVGAKRKRTGFFTLRQYVVFLTLAGLCLTISGSYFINKYRGMAEKVPFLYNEFTDQADSGGSSGGSAFGASDLTAISLLLVGISVFAHVGILYQYTKRLREDVESIKERQTTDYADLLKIIGPVAGEKENKQIKEVVV